MSSLWENEGISKISQQYKNNSKLFSKNSIVYSEDSNRSEMLESMKNGYIEMGKINLELAVDSESEFVDVDKYETWLCGE